MNKYLEKISSFTKEALNAVKARQMAKQVGVIPDADSAWKYALRSLRGSRGAPLQGKALSEGRIRLGDLSNNAYQQISSASRRHGSSTEIAGSVSRSGGLQAGLVHEGDIGGMSVVLRRGDNFHTHPSGGERRLGAGASEGLRYHLQYPHRAAAPSGLHQMGDKITLKNKSVLRAENEKYLENRPSVERVKYLADSIDRNYKRKNKLINFAMNGTNDTAKMQKAIDITDRITRANRNKQALVLPPVPLNLQNPAVKYSSGDIRAFLHSDPGGIQRVVAPHANTVSATSVPKRDSLSNPRTIYFDHTPRKAR